MLIYLLGGVLLTGSVISGIFTKDTRWMDWHFSRLGEGGGVPAMVFNLTLILVAIIVFFLGKEIIKNIDHIAKSTNTDLTHGRNIIFWSFMMISISFFGVAIFPFDRFSLVHDIFGYSILFILLILSVILEKYFPIFTKFFNSYSGLILPITVACYTLFAGLRVVSLLAIETVIFIMLYGWLLLLIRELRTAGIQT